MSQIIQSYQYSVPNTTTSVHLDRCKNSVVLSEIRRLSLSRVTLRGYPQSKIPHFLIPNPAILSINRETNPGLQ